MDAAPKALALSHKTVAVADLVARVASAQDDIVEGDLLDELAAALGYARQLDPARCRGQVERGGRLLEAFLDLPRGPADLEQIIERSQQNRPDRDGFVRRGQRFGSRAGPKVDVQ